MCTLMQTSDVLSDFVRGAGEVGQWKIVVAAVLFALAGAVEKIGSMISVQVLKHFSHLGKLSFVRPANKKGAITRSLSYTA
jgi:hypothetical protein